VTGRSAADVRHRLRQYRDVAQALAMCRVLRLWRTR
jgi:hypothetical protein